MKKSIHIITVILIFSTSLSFAQKGTTGIYLSAEDFLSSKLTYTSKDTQLKLHELLEKDHLEVKYNDSTFSYLKKDVYGYLDKEGNAFRFLMTKYIQS